MRERNEGKVLKVCVRGPAKCLCASVLMSLCVLSKENIKWVS